MAWEETHRKIRQSKDRVRRFLHRWRVRPFVAEGRDVRSPVSVTRDGTRWRVTYFAEGQPAGYSTEKTFRKAVATAQNDYDARLETAREFKDPAAEAERVLVIAKRLSRRAASEDKKRIRDGRPPSALWSEALDYYSVAADALEEIGQSFRADAVRRSVEYLTAQRNAGWPLRRRRRRR